MNNIAPKLEESSCYQNPMDDGQWNRLLRDLRLILLCRNWDETYTLVQAIRERVEWLDPIMKNYCELTCPDCQDPCCDGRKIFFNRTDMLYLTALNLTTPPGQTRTNAFAPCRYLTSSGCSLPRTIRPYVCVWFLCEAHMDIFQEEPVAFQRRFIKTLEQIRSYRLKLESMYERHYPEG